MKPGGGFMSKDIIEGTPEWENICEQCGLCCLVKYCDLSGNFYLTNVRCAALDKNTHKCNCYAADVNSRDNGCENCVSLRGMRVTRETINNDYPVPSFCPYVKKFCNNHVSQEAKNKPDIDWENTVSEMEMEDGDSLKNFVIPGSNKYFKYNRHVNEKIREILMVLR